MIKFWIVNNMSSKYAHLVERCVLKALCEFASLNSRPQQILFAGSAEHIVNGRFNVGKTLPNELGWSSDDVALYGAKLLLDVFAQNGY